MIREYFCVSFETVTLPNTGGHDVTEWLNRVGWPPLGRLAIVLKCLTKTHVTFLGRSPVIFDQGEKTTLTVHRMRVKTGREQREKIRFLRRPPAKSRRPIKFAFCAHYSCTHTHTHPLMIIYTVISLFSRTGGSAEILSKIITGHTYSGGGQKIIVIIIIVRRGRRTGNANEEEDDGV